MTACFWQYVSHLASSCQVTVFTSWLMNVVFFYLLTNCSCGSKQSGNYLDGAAPDGVMGLGPGEISVPSLLAKSGFVPHSFSLCFGKSNSGTIFFGDKGPENQRRSSFVSLDGN